MPSWLGQVALGAALMVTVLLSARSAWWLVILIPHTLAVLAGAFQAVTTDNHVVRRRLVLGLHLECALVAVVSLHMISLWFVILALLGWLALAPAFDGSEQTSKGRTT